MPWSRFAARAGAGALVRGASCKLDGHRPGLEGSRGRQAAREPPVKGARRPDVGQPLTRAMCVCAPDARSSAGPPASAADRCQGQEDADQDSCPAAVHRGSLEGTPELRAQKRSAGNCTGIWQFGLPRRDGGRVWATEGFRRPGSSEERRQLEKTQEHMKPLESGSTVRSHTDRRGLTTGSEPAGERLFSWCCCWDTGWVDSLPRWAAAGHRRVTGQELPGSLNAQPAWKQPAGHGAAH